jgi:hypothetical protein
MTNTITTDGLADLPPPSATLAGGPAQWAISSGSADIIEVSYDPPITGLVDGILLAFRYTASGNLTSTPTFSPDGNTGITIRKNAGGLSANDLKTSGEYLVRYNSSLVAWTLVGG